MRKRIAAMILASVLVLAALPLCAWGDEPREGDVSQGSANGADVAVSEEGEAALASGASFAFDDFSRAQKGSNRDVDGTYIGYAYYQGASDDYLGPSLSRAA